MGFQRVRRHVGVVAPDVLQKRLPRHGLLFRTVHLFFLKDVQTGLVWLTKIVTDPFHDIMLYYKAPLYLLRGELIAPLTAANGLEASLSAHDA